MGLVYLVEFEFEPNYPFNRDLIRANWSVNFLMTANQYLMKVFLKNVVNLALLPVPVLSTRKWEGRV